MTTHERSGRSRSRLGLEHADRPVDARRLGDDPAAISGAVTTGSVFGRVTPHQKRAMVGALQAEGHTVAMTGDGVNDVLALKDADVGVSMGSGSAATRSVAQLVLLDNRFAVLPRVVAEGRRVIGNVERVAKLFLTKTCYGALMAADDRRRRPALPVPPPPPDARHRGDHRHPRLRPGADAEP